MIYYFIKIIVFVFPIHTMGFCDIPIISMDFFKFINNNLLNLGFVIMLHLHNIYTLFHCIVHNELMNQMYN